MENEKGYRISPRIFSILILLILFATVRYGLLNKQGIIQQNSDYTAQMAVELAERFNQTCQVASGTVRLLATTFQENGEAPSVLKMQHIVDDTVFSSINWTDREGILHRSDGTTLDVKDHDCFQRGMQKKSGIELQIDEREAIYGKISFYYPVVQDSQVQWLLSGILSDEDLRWSMNVDFFGQAAKIYLCLKDGRILSTTDPAVDTNRETVNVWDICARGELTDCYLDRLPKEQMNWKTLQKVMERSGSFGFTFRRDGKTGNGYVRSLNQGNLSLVVEFPLEVTGRMVGEALFDTMHLVVWIVVAFTIYIFLNYKSNQQIQKTLRRAKELAESANREKSTFLSRMSHDMRTPMNGIMGMTTIAQENIGNQERVKDCLNKIYRSSQHLLSLINEVLDMSRIESGNIQVNKAAFSMGELMENIEIQMRPLAEAKRQSFEIHAREIAEDWVEGDFTLLERCLLNLVGNAVKYTPDRGKITMTAQRLQERLYQFVVEDNGIGMTEDFQKLVFEPFARAEDSRISKIQGTGLGLAITKRLIEEMQGSLTLRSQTNQGSCFTIRIPLPAAAAEARQSREIYTTQDLKQLDYTGVRVLLAEDNEINMEIARELLEMTGLTVDGAENGAYALEMLEAAPAGTYQMVLMDIQMPVMDGYEATRAIRSSGREDLRKIPIVALSANAYREDVEKSLKMGMNDHLSKPMELDKVEMVLRKWLGREESK